LSPIEILSGARELVREGWTQGTFARDSNGTACIVLHRDAVVFCVIGAMVRAAGGMTAAWREAFAAFREPIDGPVPYWNDNVSFEEMVAHFDETIATVKSRIPDTSGV